MTPSHCTKKRRSCHCKDCKTTKRVFFGEVAKQVCFSLYKEGGYMGVCLMETMCVVHSGIEIRGSNHRSDQV